MVLDTYLGQDKVCVWALYWDKFLDRKESANFGVDVIQLLQVRGLWGVALACQHGHSPHVVLEENHCWNKSWSTGYIPNPLFCGNLNRGVINIIYLWLITTLWQWCLKQGRGTSLTPELGIHFWMVNRVMITLLHTACQLYSQMPKLFCLFLTVTSQWDSPYIQWETVGGWWAHHSPLVR